MPFGVAPFMGLDSLVSRRVQALRGSGLLPQVDPNAVISSMPDVPGRIGNAEAQYQADHPPPTSFLVKLGQRLTSDEGIAALSAGLKAGQGAGGLEALLGGFTGGLAARRGVQTAHEAELQKMAEDAGKRKLEERRVAADEMRALADKTQAERTAASRETTTQKLAAELDLLDQLGASDEQILNHFLATRGTRGGLGGGTGRLTDRESLAQSLVATGQAENMDIARVMAARITSVPQQVGYIERLVPDPKEIDGYRRVHMTVFRQMNPQTGQWEVVDQFNQPLSAQEQAGIRANLSDYPPDVPPPPPPPKATTPPKAPDKQTPAGGLHNFIRRG